MSDLPKLIVVEGIDFTGKTTLIKTLAAQLTSVGLRVVCYNSPNNILPIGRTVRQHLLAAGSPEYDPTAMGFLMLATIRELAQHIVDTHLPNGDKPANKPVDVILLDRWYYTTLAYNNVSISDNQLTRYCLGEAIDGVFEGLFPTGQIPEDNSTKEEDGLQWMEYFQDPDAIVTLRGAEIAHRRSTEIVREEAHHLDSDSLDKFIAREERLIESVRDSHDIADTVWIDVEIGNRVEEIVANLIGEMTRERLITLPKTFDHENDVVLD